ncbi:MAG: radical SAM protein [Elusimicrobia bacterium]|nr:radical SAM protein [Elusimicrobiota bacterium]
MPISRREFIKKGLIVAGTAAVAPKLFAGAVLDRSTQVSSTAYVPKYIELERSGELARREKALWDLYSPCVLCPRLCKANRAQGQAGACSAASSFRVASYGLDFACEPPIHGTNGSGGIFLSNCNLLCVFCQNWQIAHRGDGRETSIARLAEIMLELQQRGGHNVTFISPTHLVPQIVSAMRVAIRNGLSIPIVFDTSGYESLEVIKLLDGIVDIYQPDFKFQDSAIAARFTHGAPDFVTHTAAAIKEMHRQVGVLQIANGLAYRGILMRHLVLPENLSGTDVFVRWVADELSPDTHVNISPQFWPAFRSHEFPPLNRRLTRTEHLQAMRWARAAGLHNFW